MTNQEKSQKVIIGQVVGNKMDKTAVILIERKVKHALYGKYIKRSTKIKIRDAKNQCNIGDFVSVQECKPISKHKHWTLLQVLDEQAQS